MIYGSHTRVLAALGGLRPVSVLELGGGRHSTRLFLSKAVFPALEQLVTVEQDPHWRSLVESGDPRQQVVDRCDSLDFDLIFIDDQITTEARVLTIEKVAGQRPNAVVVIHDFNKPEYQQAAKFDHQVSIPTRFPWTGVCWNEDSRYRGSRVRGLLARA